MLWGILTLKIIKNKKNLNSHMVECSNMVMMMMHLLRQELIIAEFKNFKRKRKPDKQRSHLFNKKMICLKCKMQVKVMNSWLLNLG